ncbi:MFS transporter [Brevibacillus sp. SYP-B805]|uniref:MDR family MFS transporter n=1 Tax=Brevibacillus sp. SYP-B805 TaxID=1578199 RepID=UPI0013ED3970|nr:MDR family MFS transporter [Brevibacillus sp. SYP-B805]NGQ95146.1 MFS transporter [Brevibacillus sp. SYP-B805]
MILQRLTNTRIVTIAVMIATFLAAIEGTIVSTAMPTIVGELGGLTMISWVVSVYMLTSAVTSPIYGKLADLFGRKVVFAVGTLLFLAGSMLSGLAQTMGQLIWFRAVQGIGAGSITLTYTIVGDIYPFEQRGKIQGYMSGIWGISGILGPLTGGFLVDYVSWRWIFYMNLPFGILSVILIWLYLHENLEKKRKHVDYPGALAFTIGMSALLYALLSGGTTHPWGAPLMVVLYAAALVGLALFLYIQWKSPEPMLPLILFKIRAITVSNAAGFLLSSVLVAISFYLPVWIQGVYGQGATASGMTLLPMSIGWPLAASLSGRLVVKIGARQTSLIGAATLVIAAGWLATISVHTPHWMLYVMMFLVGFGFGFTFTSFTVTTISAVDWHLRGAAMASSTFIRALGQTLGIAVFGTLFNHALTGRLPADLAAQGFDINKVLHPDGAASLPPETLQAVREALAYGLERVFLVLALIALAGLLVTLAFPKAADMRQQSQ